MSMQILQNDMLGRVLHNALHQRLIHFAEQHTPELPAEPVVELWLSAFYNGDNKNIHILVDVDNQCNITGHCICIFNNEYGYKILHALQLQDDKKSGSFLDECMEYMEKLAQENEAHCIVLSVQKSAKAMEKKFGYKISRTMMYKIAGQ